MAVYSYGASNVNFSSTDNWANNVTSATNIRASGSNSWGTDIDDDLGATNISLGDLRNDDFFYGTVNATSNGQVRVSAPYTTSYTNGSITVKNVNFSDHATVTLQASATYPYVFTKWSSDSGGSDSLGTNTSLNLTSTDNTSVTAFYAIFGNPSSNTLTNLGYHASSDETSCNNSGTTIYWHSDDGSTWYDAFKLYSNASLTTTVADGRYSNNALGGDGKVVTVTNGIPGIPRDCAIP